MANLQPMRYKDYVWPYNPRTYTITYHRAMVAHKISYGHYVLENLGPEYRVMTGSGEFVGTGAYEQFGGLRGGQRIKPMESDQRVYTVLRRFCTAHLTVGAAPARGLEGQRAAAPDRRTNAAAESALAGKALWRLFRGAGGG